MKISECKMIVPVTAELSETVVAVAQRMVEKQVKHVIVVDNKIPVGIVSMSDIVTRVVANAKDAGKTVVKEVMTSPMASIDHECSVEQAFALMIKQNVFSVAVTKEGKLVGLLPFTNKLQENVC